MPVEEGAGQFIGTRLRHHLDEADDGGNQEEDADHRQHAENAEHDLVFELVLEDDEGRGRDRQHDRKQDDAQHRAGPRAAIHDRHVVVTCLVQFRHEALVCRPVSDAPGMNARDPGTALWPARRDGNANHSGGPQRGAQESSLTVPLDSTKRLRETCARHSQGMSRCPRATGGLRPAAAFTLGECPLRACASPKKAVK